MIRKILLGLLLGFIFTLVQLPHDPFFQQLVTGKFTEIFGNAFDCRLAFKHAHIDIWTPALVLEDVQVTPNEGAGWSWTAKSYSTRCSWWYLWHHKALDLDMCFENLVAESNYHNGDLAIGPHVKKMVLGKPLIPLVITQLQLLNARFIVNQDGKQIAHFNWNSNTCDRQGILHSKLQLVDGTILVGNQELKNLTAQAMCDIAPCVQQPGFTMQGSCIFDTHTDKPTLYTATASWICDVGMLDIAGSDATAIHCELESEKQTGSFSCTVPLIAGKKCAAMAGYSLPEIPGNLMVEGRFNYSDSFALVANYECKTRFLDKDLHTRGCLNLDADQITLKGNAHDFTYHAVVDKNQSYLKKATLSDQHSPIFSIAGDSKNAKHYTLQADLALANIICAPLFDSCPVKGQLNAQVIFEPQVCQIDLSTNQLFVLIPHSFYTLKEIKSNLHINYDEHKITIKDSCLSFDQGSVTCAHGIAQFDAEYKWQSVYAPIKINKVPIKLDPSIQGALSGQLTFTQKNNEKGRIEGALLIDDATVRALECVKHLLSSGKKTELTLDLDCDVSLATRAPIKIDAPVLQSNLIIDMHIANTLRNPHFTGTCSLHNAIVALLYKPLYIEKGQLTFISGQSAPLIDLLATSKIKNYDLLVQAVGTLDNYQIIFSSSPYLEQQEIMALLLSGNPKSSITTLVPTITCQLLLDYLGYAKNSLSPSTRAWLAPLERVRLVPHFDDQSARGGIRAAFEIAVTDQLTALIQKNFSLTEDTLWQLEYAFTDDIALRATRDERRDLNAEIEMRWKF